MAIINGGNGNDPLNGGNGNDTLNGGNRNDTLNGGAGIDTLNGGNGNDIVKGDTGDDIAFLGNGNDKFIWNPGDGNDKVDGGNGFDTLDFRGANIAETIDISANGSHAKFLRPNPPGTIDLTDVERIQFEAQGVNADTITINDLTGTGVKQVAIDVGAGADSITINDVTGTDLVTIDLGADAQADTVNIISTNGQAITFTEDNNGVVTVSGLANDLTISNFEDGVDQLEINGQIQPVAKGQTGTVTAVNSNNTGTSTASDGSHATGLALLGQHMASSFVTAGDGHGGTPIQDQPSSHQPSLTHPHA